jgi:hypothetical protein
MSLPEEFKRRAYQGTPDCAIGAVAITPDTPLAVPSRGLYVGGAGNATITFANGDIATLNGLIAGLEYPFSVINVSSTDLTASNFVATY